MSKQNLFVFVRIQGERPEVVGDQLRDQISEIREIFSVMGEHDLMIRISFSDFDAIQRFVTERIRSHPNVVATYTFLGYELYGKVFPGFDYPSERTS